MNQRNSFYAGIGSRETPIESGFDTLPALTDNELSSIATQTQATLVSLLTNDAFSPNTLRGYASALRYWDAWHRAAYATALPLLATPRQPVPLEHVRAFVAHHSPVTADGRIGMAMPATVLARMEQLGAIGARQASKRGANIDRNLPTLATIRQRLAALSACHRIAEIEPEWLDDPVLKRALRALGNRASKSTPAMLRKPKADVSRGMLNAMLRECATDGLRGLRDAALLHVVFHTGGRRRSELIQMQWPDLVPYELPESVHGVRDGYLWSLREVKGKRRERADIAAMEIPILGDAAAALDRWRYAVLAAGFAADGPAWYRVVPKRRKEEGVGAWVISTPMIEADVWSIIRQRAGQIGLRPDDFGAHSLRSGGATTFLREGGSLSDAANMLGHEKIDTTREFYDRRGVPAEAVARLVGKPEGRR